MTSGNSGKVRSRSESSQGRKITPRAYTVEVLSPQRERELMKLPPSDSPQPTEPPKSPALLLCPNDREDSSDISDSDSSISLSSDEVDIKDRLRHTLQIEHTSRKLAKPLPGVIPYIPKLPNVEATRQATAVFNDSEPLSSSADASDESPLGGPSDNDREVMSGMPCSARSSGGPRPQNNSSQSGIAIVPSTSTAAVNYVRVGHMPLNVQRSVDRRDSAPQPPPSPPSGLGSAAGGGASTVNSSGSAPARACAGSTGPIAVQPTSWPQHAKPVIPQLTTLTRGSQLRTSGAASTARMAIGTRFALLTDPATSNGSGVGRTSQTVIAYSCSPRVHYTHQAPPSCVGKGYVSSTCRGCVPSPQVVCGPPSTPRRQAYAPLTTRIAPARMQQHGVR